MQDIWRDQFERDWEPDRSGGVGGLLSSSHQVRGNHRDSLPFKEFSHAPLGPYTTWRGNFTVQLSTLCHIALLHLVCLVLSRPPRGFANRPDYLVYSSRQIRETNMLYKR